MPECLSAQGQLHDGTSHGAEARAELSGDQHGEARAGWWGCRPHPGPPTRPL